MKAKWKFAVPVIVAISVGVGLWMGWWRGDTSVPPPAAKTAQPVTIEEVVPEPVPTTPAVIPVVVDAEKPVPGPPPPPPLPGERGRLAPGQYLKYPSDDFQMFMTLTSVSGLPVGTGAELTPRDGAMLRAVLRTNDLTDDELRKIIEYSKIAIAATQARGVEEQSKICSEREKITNLDQLGAVLNANSRSTEAHQEELARSAREYLGAETFGKLSRSLQAQPKSQISEHDVTLVMHSRGWNAEEVLERFCSHGQ